MFPETGKTARGRRGREKKIGEAVRWFLAARAEKYRSPGDEPRGERDDGLGSSRGTAKPLKNSDNTSPGGGAHLNVCIHTLVYRFDERCGQNYSN